MAADKETTFMKRTKEQFIHDVVESKKEYRRKLKDLPFEEKLEH
jgi:hypothetical protein